MICQEFVDSSDTQQEIIVAWLAGFANGASEPKIVDDEAVMDDADDFNEFCKKNPETSLLQAEMQLFQ